MTVSNIAVLLSGSFRLAISVGLALAVLLAGTGMHPTSHCSDHGGDTAPSVVVEISEQDHGEDEGGLCLNCDCTCQTIYLGDTLAIQMPAADIVLLVRSDVPVLPDEVVLEVEPPPVRVS